MKKVIIYPKDIMMLTGKSERYSRLLLNKIKATLNKESHQLVTINELALYLGISLEEVSSVIK